MNLLRRGDVDLAFDQCGAGKAGALCLHGLAGWAGEWGPTAKWLSTTHRVVTLDQRGHGRSTRHPGDVSRAAYVADAAAVIEATSSGPLLLIGQSLGGHTAMLVAAQRPDLVERLIVVEASPDRDPLAPERIRRWLSSWPVPFRDRNDATAFFRAQGIGDASIAAELWTGGLEQRRDGLWPRFDIEIMLNALQDVAAYEYWERWSSINCPTLIVRGQHGALSTEQADRMVQQHPRAQLIEISGAGHDVHLDQPDRWRTAVERFIANESAS